MGGWVGLGVDLALADGIVVDLDKRQRRVSIGRPELEVPVLTHASRHGAEQTRVLMCGHGVAKQHLAERWPLHGHARVQLLDVAIALIEHHAPAAKLLRVRMPPNV